MNQNQDKFTVLDVGIKAKSKLEIYWVLTTEGGIYLPPIKEWNYQFIRDIITGAKLVCFENDMISASMERMLFASQYHVLKDYL